MLDIYKVKAFHLGFHFKLLGLKSLLIQLIFKAFTMFLKFIIRIPPSALSFTTTSLLIFSRFPLPHKN